MFLPPTQPPPHSPLLDTTLRRLIGLGHPDFARAVVSLKAASGSDFCLLTLSDGLHQQSVGNCGSVTLPVDDRFAFFTYVLAQVAPLVVDDARSDWRFRYHPHVLCEPLLRSFAGQALRAAGRPVGTLCVAARTPAAFDRLDLALFATLTEQIERVLAAEVQASGQLGASTPQSATSRRTDNFK